MNFDPDEPMDNHLLQLERELFSLTPVETPRRFVSQLEREVTLPVSPMPVARRISAQHRVITPFRWQRIVVPAAAAVVVVSVLNRQGGGYAPNTVDAAVNHAPSARNPMSSPADMLLRSRQMNTGYMMMTEQSPLQNVNWSSSPNQYWVNPETHSSPTTPLVLPRRETVPVSFH
ncbi:MAG: hypothetical protein V4726_19145 [Verrucomicrobiota bacterium]